MTPPPGLAATQDAARVTGNEAWAIVSRLIAGMLLYGALGWALGSWLGAATAGAAIGVLTGLGFGLWLSILRVNELGTTAPALEISGHQSWTARMTRARVERKVD